MLSTNIGNMGHRVEWFSVTETSTNGKIGTSETSQGTFWANVRAVAGDEGMTNNKVQAGVTWQVTMRRVGAIKPKDRLLYDGHSLHIVSVIDTNERKRELVITCKEIPSQ